MPFLLDKNPLEKGCQKEHLELLPIAHSESPAEESAYCVLGSASTLGSVSHPREPLIREVMFWTNLKESPVSPSAVAQESLYFSKPRREQGSGAGILLPSVICNRVLACFRICLAQQAAHRCVKPEPRSVLLQGLVHSSCLL